MAFESITTLQIRGRVLDLSTARVMGIINVTDDSFYAGSRRSNHSAALAQAEQMITEGVDIIDIGGASSRPGAQAPSTVQESNAVLPIIKAIRLEHPLLPISIDTYSSAVASMALQSGADIVNDISAGTMDTEMLSVVSRLQSPIILMHMQGEPGFMQEAPQYEDVVVEVNAYLSERIDACRAAGIKDIIIDPGFGFGKTDEHNFRLMKNLKHFKMLGVPVLVGVSRKSMIQRTLAVSAEKALNGTTALHMAALLSGASILRVHDVAEAVQCIKLTEAIRNS